MMMSTLFIIRVQTGQRFAEQHQTTDELDEGGPDLQNARSTLSSQGTLKPSVLVSKSHSLGTTTVGVPFTLEALPAPSIDCHQASR